ncbi:2-hydroxyacid dehydrogenase [Acidaminobacter hydrogenoformans]|uniref:D-3-phosphoglycerate dehydrogenase n=1 Tax=Acidaminobacter hydrogenoformans DSM 2784 TaxID=1120920 RepID=A0A1G5RZR7_9FIRM|nr:2-hydroxyacid dehydrogenase [Acidaminobacter hydrogenoformans]SCZ79506.1 D-3-phosphoglycerate dehydrogenase [Acidaminobacter hydrogenoformans DSM 2784]
MKVALVGIFPNGTIEMFKERLRPERFEIEIIDTQEKYDNLIDAEVIVLRLFKVTRGDIERNKNLKLIQKWGAGFDTIDIEAAGENNVFVSNAPGANAFAVSELAILQILAVYRNLVVQHEAMKNGEWTKTSYTDRSYIIHNKVVGLIGCGNIGKDVAKKVQAFGAKVIYYDAIRMSEEDEHRLQMEYCELDDILRLADIISLHLPLNDKTRNLINKDKIELMKPTAIIVNTSRGGIVNEADLIQALENKRLLGAGLDCIENEPVRTDDPILKAPNVTLTPHIGGTSADIAIYMVPLMVENIISFAEGKGVKHVVNGEHLNKREAV